jgi:DNA repair protein RecO (recombination protein O)
MLNKTAGIILHTTKYSETSLIVKVLTNNKGIQSYIISGIRNKKSQNRAGVFQPLSLVELVTSGNEKSSLQRIKEISVDQPYNHLPYDIIKSSIGIFLNEVIIHSLKEPHPDEDMYLFIKNSLLILDLNTGTDANFHLIFMIQFSRFLGFFPQGEYSNETPLFDLQEGKFVQNIPHHSFYLNPASSRIFSQLIRSSYSDSAKLSVNRPERKAMLDSLLLFYHLHINSFGEIRSMKVLEEIIA